MSYITATTLEDALNTLAAGPASVIAGGTDWFPAQADRQFRGTLLDISRLSELRGITRTDNGWTIGAATTWTDIGLSRYRMSVRLRATCAMLRLPPMGCRLC